MKICSVRNLYKDFHTALLKIYKNALINSQIESFPNHLFWIYIVCYIYDEWFILVIDHVYPRIAKIPS